MNKSLPGIMIGLLLAASAAALDTVPLRRAIEDLAVSFPGQYTNAAQYLARLNTVRDEASFNILQREALLANPLVSGQPILFVVRNQYKSDHHNTETMFQTGEINTGSFQGGGAIKIVEFAGGGKVRILVDAGTNGVARDPDVYFDGSKVLFSMRRTISEDYHLYEVAGDGSGLRQLTSAKGVFDIDPLYLPDDSIVFTSLREPKYCMCNRHIMGNLFRMAGDGANIHQIGKSTLFEGHGSLMPDGRIMYDRWEYVDRNFGSAQGLWTVNPDGTSHLIYWGNYTASPGAVLDGRIIPGTLQTICTFSSCHDRPWGALAIIDRRMGLDGRAAVVRTWPTDAACLVDEDGDFDAFRKVMPKYEDPYPLSEKYFLCSRMTGRTERMGIYLLDIFGNEILLHEEAQGCYDPMPLSARERPPSIPTRRHFDNTNGLFYIENVYEGTHMLGVKPGDVKFLRVVESPEKRFWTYPNWVGQGAMAPAMNWHDFNNKRILGTVPVEPDGSAWFTVPPDTFLYFQLLDERGMMIQSMRSGTILQSGEVQGCIGCHDERRAAPRAYRKQTLAALRREPSRLEGWHGPQRLFNYLAEVQPVFNRACVKCHDFGSEAGRKLNLAGDRGLVFNASYSDLWSRGMIKVAGAGPSVIQQARSWGSSVSRLANTLLKGHHGVKLTPEEFDRIVTWIDINAPYYPSYASAYPANQYGRSPLDAGQLARLAGLGVDLRQQGTAGGVSFDRPELSPRLAVFTDKTSVKYVEALAIIRSGGDALRMKPESDMPEFRACTLDGKRDLKYKQRFMIEQRNRKAIREGKLEYD